MLTVAIHQPQYLPWLPYLDKAAAADVFVYLDCVQYQTNGVQNRNRIAMAGQPRWLTVPVHASTEGTIATTRIAGNGWRRKHLETLRHAYARAPERGLIPTGLAPHLEHEDLAGLCIAVTEWMFDALGVRNRRLRASELAIDGRKEDLVLSICAAVGADRYVSGEGARAYQQPARFRQRGIELVYHSYQGAPYAQAGAGEFLPDLSTLDLLLNHGAGAARVFAQGQRRLTCPTGEAL